MQVGSALKKSKSKSTGSLPKSLLLKHSAHKSSKSARAYKQTYSSGPPLIPAYIFNRLMEYTAKIKIPRKAHFVDMVCRYWSLKRESRRGAPLLKRLHLEVRSTSECLFAVTRDIHLSPSGSYSHGQRLLVLVIRPMRSGRRSCSSFNIFVKI